MFSKKHFEAVAKQIKALKELKPEVFESNIDYFVFEFSKNPRFDKERFLQACNS